MNNPPTAGCTACGLFKSHPGNLYMQPLRDERPEVIYGQISKKVLFVIQHPTEVEAHSGYLSDSLTDWVNDYLIHSQFEYCVTSLVLCYPGKKGQTDGYKEIKPTPKQVSTCTGLFLEQLIDSFQPDILVAMGGESLKALWPSTRGVAPSINKARLMPVKLEGRFSHIWLVAAYEPRLQGYYEQSGGTRGTALDSDYERMFSLLHSLCEGSYKESTLEYSFIKSQGDFINLLDRLDAQAVTKLYLDVEDDTWIGTRIRPWKEDPEGIAPQKLTLFHDDNKLLLLGITAVVESWVDHPDGGESFKKLASTHLEVYEMLPQAWAGRPDLSRRLVNHRCIEAWNTKYDCQSTYVLDADFPDLLEDETLNVSLGDGFLLRGLQDQSKTGNSLKFTSGELLSIPDWSHDLDQGLNRAKLAIRQQNLEEAKAAKAAGLPQPTPKPELVSMGMLPLDILLPYNAHDTRENARLVEEKLHAGLLPANFPWKVYRMLLDGMGWLATMERNGVPVNTSKFEALLDASEGTEERLGVALKQLPEVQRAEAATALAGKPKEFNLASPIFYAAFVQEMHGQLQSDGTIQIPESFPKTDSGRLSSNKEVTATLAGEDPKAPVEWDKKSRPQKIWTRIREWKHAKDDFARLMGLFDYVVEDRIHATFRILKTESQAGEDNDDGGDEGGSKSRFSTSPNIQNLWERVKALFEAPEGWLWVCPDFGRAEIAWLAWNTKDPLLMQWSNEGRDQHRAKGEFVWSSRTKNPIEDFSKLSPEDQETWRDFGKTQNFATIYQEEPYTTAAKNLITVDSVLADLAEGRRMHPGVYEAMMRLYAVCQGGGMATSCFGRLWSPQILTNEGLLTWERDKQTAEQFLSLDLGERRKRNQRNCAIFRSLWNVSIAQSDSSDMTFCVGKRAHQRLKSGKWLDPSKVEEVNFVHDSPHYLVKEDYLDEAAPELMANMRDLKNAKLPEPFGLEIPVDCKVGRNLSKDKAVEGHLRSYEKWKAGEK